MDSTLRIVRPSAGERLTLSVSAEAAGQPVRLGFETSGVEAERNGNDLIFRFEDGAETRVTDFFLTGGKNLPNFILEDGTELAGADVLRLLNDELDVTPAAGPDAGNASGGAGEYASDPGALLGGVNALGIGDGMGQWGLGGAGGLDGGAVNVNIPVGNITTTLLPLTEDTFAPGNTWSNGASIMVGVVSGTDPDGGGVTYGVAPGQQATVITDDGSILVLGTYSINAATGELFIDLADHSSNPAAQAACEALINSLRAGASYSLSPVTVTLSDGLSTVPVVVTPSVEGVNDAPEATGAAAGFGASEHGFALVAGAETANGPLLDMKPHFTDADYGDHASLQYAITEVALSSGANLTNLLDGADQTALNDFISKAISSGALSIENGVLQLDNSKLNLDSLGVGKSFDLTIKVQATDPSGASVTKDVTLTIHGVNDAPEATGDSAKFEASENGFEWVSGAETANDPQIDMTRHFTDADLGDHAALQYAITNVALDGSTPVTALLDPADQAALNTFISNALTSGALTIVNGQLKLDNTMLNLSSLPRGDSFNITIQVQATDPAGDSVSKDVTLTIHGANNAPRATTGSASFEAGEHGFEWVSGAETTNDPQIDMTQHFTDADLGDHAALQYAITNVALDGSTPVTALLDSADQAALNTFISNALTSGALTIVNGQLKLDNTMLNLDSLGKGDSFNITIKVQATDPDGASDTKDVTLTIHGVNDAPEATTGSASFAAGEHGFEWVSGDETTNDPQIDMTQHFTDADLGDHAALQYAVTNVALDGSTPVTGLLDSADQATLNTFISNALTSGALTIVNGQLKLDNSKLNLDSLGKGDSFNITITVQADDGNGGTAYKDVTLTIHGVNDAPKATPGSASFAAGEHGFEWVSDDETTNDPQIDMTQHFTDADLGDHAALQYAITNVALDGSTPVTGLLDSADQATLNTFISNALTSGALTIVNGQLKLDNTKLNLDSLGKGDSFNIKITVQADDGNGGTAYKDVTLTIHGVNDAPEATTGQAQIEVSEHGLEWVGNAEGSGNASIRLPDHFTDADLGDHAGLVYTIGTVAIPTGQESAVQSLLSASDWSALQTFLANAGGQLSIDGSGNLVLDNSKLNLDSLGQGKSITITVPVTANDGNGGTASKDVTLVIRGMNDDTRVDNNNPVEFHMSESGKEWTGGSEGPNAFGMVYDASQHFSDLDTGEEALLAYSITGVTIGGDTSALSGPELAALQAAIQSMFSIDPQTGLVTYDAAKLTDVTRLSTGETLKITVTVQGTDGKTAVPPTKDLELNIHGTESGPRIGGDLAPDLDEPGSVSWWNSSSGSPAATNPDGLSDKYTTVDLSFTDADTGDGIKVTITAPDGSSISFTTDHLGNVDSSSFSGGVSHLDGDWGRLSWNDTAKSWEYRAFNKADTLNPNDFTASSKLDALGNGLDKFVIKAEDPTNGSLSKTETLEVTVNAVDDSVIVYDTPITHEQAAQILGPYLDASTKSTKLNGTLNIMDIDDHDNSIAFMVKDPVSGEFKLPVSTGSGPSYVFDLEYGKITITWDPTASGPLDALNGTGNETGGWVYEYEYTAPANSVQLNSSLTESIEIKAYDPDLYDPLTGQGQSADLGFDVTVITTQFDTGYPRPVYDVLQIDMETQDMNFGLGSAARPFGPDNNNLLDNDRTIANNDAAEYDTGSSSWIVDPNTSVTAESITTEYGVLTVNADGTFSFTPDWNHADLMALPKGESMTVTVPYTVTESGKSFTSYLVIQFDGKNDAPVGRSGIQINVSHGFGDGDGVYVIDQALASDVDGDALTYTFYVDDGAGGWTAVTGTNDDASVFDPDDFGLGPNFQFDPNNNLAPGQQFTQMVDPGPGGKVYNVEYGWLIHRADGSMEFVVNKNHKDVIKLGQDQKLEFEIKFDVSDGSLSDSNTIKISISGGYDKLAIRPVGDGTLSGTYFDKETVNGEETQLFSYGAERNSTVSWDGSHYVFNQVTGDSLAIDNAAHSGGGHAGQMYFNSNLANLVKGLDTSGSQKYSFTFNNSATSVDLYGKDASGNIVLLGKLNVSNSVGLNFYATDRAWSNAWEIKGVFTEFFIDKNGKNPLQLYAQSSDDATGTKTPVDMDFTMEFKDDSPVVSGLRLSLDPSNVGVGQVGFHDVDTAADKLTLWVENGSGYLVKVENDGTTVDLGHGKIVMNKDGSFEYTRTDGNTSAENIRVVVDDGNSATQGFISVEGSTASTASLGNDVFKFGFGSNNTINAHSASKDASTGNYNGALRDEATGQREISLFDNDTGVVKNVLNSGTYILDNLVIKGAGSGASGFECGRFGSATTEVSKDFSLAAGSRFEMVLTNCTITFASDGTVQYQIKPETVKLYDTVTDQYFYFTFTNSTKAFEEIAARLNMTVKEVKDAMEFSFEYQAMSDDGQMVTGTANFDWGNAYNNSTQYYTEGMKMEQNVSTIKVNSSFDGNAMDSSNPGSLEGVKANNGGRLSIASDLNGDDVYIRYAVVDKNGTHTWQGYSAATLADQAKNGAGVKYDGNSIIPNDPSDLAIEIPVYAWIKVASDGTVSVQTATPSNLTGWECVQVGTTTFTPTYLGARSLIGYEADGTPIWVDICNSVNGTLSFALLGAGTSAKLAAFHDYIRGMSEGQLQNTMFFYLGTRDDGNIESSSKLLVAFTGTDVILGDGNLPVNVSIAEDTVLANGQVVDILAGAKHTVGDGSTNAAARTDADGWRGFDFGGGEKSVTDNGHTVEGKYGKLVWNATTQKYTYEVYSDARGDAVRGMVDGQEIKETFNYTVYDKNGESDSGQTIITINGKSDGFTVNIPAGSLLEVTEGDIVSANLGTMISTQDSGVMRYYIQFTDPVTGITISTYGNAPKDMETIETNWGRLVFSPSTGAYTFTPNGVLQAGVTQELAIKVMGELTSSNGTVQDTGWHDYNIKITGMNDAPEIGDNFFFAAAGTEVGALGWTDVDNDTAAGGFFFDAWNDASQGIAAGGLETVQGEHGKLILTQDTGSFQYILDADAFNGGGSRVVDQFGVKVTDPGNAGGAYKETSEDGTLTVYGVNGEYKTGSTGADTITINDGKSHIIWGGQGGDIINLSGSGKENVLVWREGDQGTAGTPAVDKITGFTVGNLTDTDTTNDGDILDLRGLLSDIMSEGGGNTLDDLISFTVESGKTTINIGSAADPSQAVQQIVLEGTTLTAADSSHGTYEELAHQIILITQ